MNLVDFIFKFKSKRYFFIEGLLGLFEVLHENILVILEVNISLSKLFEFFENLCILLFVNIFIIFNNFLPFLDLLLHTLHLFDFIPLDFSNHSLEISIWAILQQNRINLPKSFTDIHIFTSHFLQQSIESHWVNKQRFIDSFQVVRIESFGKQRIFVYSILF